MPPHLDNEAELIRKAQTGCRDAFAVLVNQYERHIYCLSVAVTKHADDAEDVLQETFLKAYANLKAFRGESRFYTWLVRIAINEALTKLRRDQALPWVGVEGSTDQDEPLPMVREYWDWRDNPEESCSKAELRTLLAQALCGLEAPLRIVFALRDMDGFSTEETARMLGLSVGTVKTRLMRARLQLRRKLSGWLQGHRTPANR